MDTLKVLAKRIAPGQEFMDAEHEACAKRNWYSDGSNAKPDAVFVQCSRGVLEQLLQLVRPWDAGSGNEYVWWFEKRSAADQFVALLYQFEGVTFWQVGLSRGWAMIEECPLLGYFGSPDVAARTERMRRAAYETLRPYSTYAFMSAVLLSVAVVEGNFSLPRKLAPLPKLSGEAQKRQIRPENCPDEIYLYLFVGREEGRTTFARGVATGVGYGWHFGHPR